MRTLSITRWLLLASVLSGCAGQPSAPSASPALPAGDAPSETPATEDPVPAASTEKPRFPPTFQDCPDHAEACAAGERCVMVPSTAANQPNRQVCAPLFVSADVATSDHTGEVLLEAPDVVLYERRLRCKECSPLGVALKQADGRLIPLVAGMPLEQLACTEQLDQLGAATLECPGKGAPFLLGIRHRTSDVGSTEPGLAFELLAVGPPAAVAP